MAKKRESFSDQLRSAIENCGESRYAIAKATEIDAATLARFVARKGGLSIAALDALAEHLGWTLMTPTKGTQASKRAGKSNRRNKG
jgi:hypothetical protein